MPSVLVFGGCGQLGNVVVQKLKNAGHTVIAVDLRKSESAQHSVTIKGDGSKEDAAQVVAKVKELNLGGLDAVFSVAGGFGMTSIKDEAVFEDTNKMLDYNVKSSVTAGYVAAHCLKEGGLLSLTGAYGALNPTPALIGYGISKAAVHHLVASLAQPESGLPKGTTVTALLPVMLDTPQNRGGMPDADFSSWTPLDEVATLLEGWASGKNRPKSGEMVQLKTEKGKTEFVTIKGAGAQ